MNENVPHVFNYDSNKSVRITEIDGEVCALLELAKEKKGDKHGS